MSRRKFDLKQFFVRRNLCLPMYNNINVVRLLFSYKTKEAFDTIRKLRLNVKEEERRR